MVPKLSKEPILSRQGVNTEAEDGANEGSDIKAETGDTGADTESGAEAEQGTDTEETES